jgi:hypothetical protein
MKDFDAWFVNFKKFSKEFADLGALRLAIMYRKG